MFINFLDDISLPPERGLSYSLPNLIIESGSQLIKFKYNTQTHKYESQTTVDLEGTSPPTSWKLLTLSDSIIVARNIESRHNQQKRDKSPSKLIKLSRSLEQLKVYKCADVAAMATDGNYIFVCTEGKLVALNQDLEKLNEVDLEIQYQVLREKKKKNAHDILIHQSIAYLLDNIVEPTYILRVDISNPNNLQILSTFEIIGTNHHLRKQWINPELNQWCILQYYATQGGAGQNIIILPLDLDTGSIDIDQSQIPDPTDSLNERPVILDIQSSINRYNPFSRSRNSYNSLLGYESIGYSPFHSSKWLGLDLIATTSSYPTFSLVYQEKKQFF